MFFFPLIEIAYTFNTIFVFDLGRHSHNFDRDASVDSLGRLLSILARALVSSLLDEAAPDLLVVHCILAVWSLRGFAD